MSRTVQVTFDAHDPRALSSFWRDALGYVHPGPPGVELPDGADPSAAWDAFLERMGVPEAALGAVRVSRVEPEPPLGASHIVMLDPEGNDFCLD